MIATDGVFSMDGYVAQLDQICDLAEQLRRDGHGRRLARRRLRRRATGRGTPELLRRDGPRRHHHRHARQGARRRVAAATRAAAREIVELLRQRSRPVPVLEHARAADRRPPRSRCSSCSRAATSCATRLRENTARFRDAHDRAGLRHPARRPPDRARSCSATRCSPAAWPTRCSSAGIYVIGFSYPGRARRRGAHPHADVGRALDGGHRPRDRRVRGGQNGSPRTLTGPSRQVAPSRSGRHIACASIVLEPPGWSTTTGAGDLDEPEARVAGHVLLGAEQHRGVRSERRGALQRGVQHRAQVALPAVRVRDDHGADADDVAVIGRTR